MRRQQSSREIVQWCLTGVIAILMAVLLWDATIDAMDKELNMAEQKTKAHVGQMK